MGRERYVYVEADAAGLEPIARGLRSWDEAIADGPVRVYGEPALVAALPGWFVADAAEIPILDGSGSLAPVAG